LAFQVYSKTCAVILFWCLLTLIYTHTQRELNFTHLRTVPRRTDGPFEHPELVTYH
jgi:hypothetical protein